MLPRPSLSRDLFFLCFSPDWIIHSHLHLVTHADTVNQSDVNVYNQQPIIETGKSNSGVDSFCDMDNVLRSDIRGLGHSFYWGGAIQYSVVFYANTIG